METTTMGIKELRDQLGKRADLAYFRNEVTIITNNGREMAVLISYADWLGSLRDDPGEEETPEDFE